MISAAARFFAALKAAIRWRAACEKSDIEREREREREREGGREGGESISEGISRGLLTIMIARLDRQSQRCTRFFLVLFQTRS